MRLRGIVTQRTFAKGSKSERPGVFLETDAGESFLLKRLAANPFHDAQLEELVGKRIEANGEKRAYAFYVRKWRELG
ncbi:MAG TPA: hypothetical protein VEK11_15640 [Thermoanaerobaculia bacterium]|nr:hypothetical protein [Thermoanaerobaculia bacterium]